MTRIANAHVVFWIACFSPAVFGQSGGVGDVQINIAPGLQKSSSVAVTADGHLVVVWQNMLSSIRRRRFEGGYPLDSEKKVNTNNNDLQLNPEVAADSAGNFVVVWESPGMSDDLISGIVMRRFSLKGEPFGNDFQVSTGIGDKQRFPSVAVDAKGDSVVVWQSAPVNATDFIDIKARRLTSDGEPFGNEFQVNDDTSQGLRPSVAVNAAGDFLVVWHGARELGADFDIKARLCPSEGDCGEESQVNIDTADNQKLPSVAVDINGGFIVVWQSGTGSDLDIKARLVSSNGTPLNSEFAVSDSTIERPRRPAVVAGANSNFVVVWDSGPSADREIQMRRFDSVGKPFGNEFQVNRSSKGNQTLPSVGVDIAGNLTVVWRTEDDVRGSLGVFDLK